MRLGQVGEFGTPAWAQEEGYDMFSWERLEHPYGDWLSIKDLELFVGDMPHNFPGSIRFNHLFCVSATTNILVFNYSGSQRFCLRIC